MAPPTPRPPALTREVIIVWATRTISALALVVVAWVAITAFPMLIHGQPTYLVLLVITVVVAVAGSVWSWRRLPLTARRRQLARFTGLAAALGWVVLVGWLAPSVAVQPAIGAMTSTSVVTVSETPAEIVLTPTDSVSDTGLFFQPGAKVDARAYVAVLRPVAASGHIVVIPKQPLGIAFLSTGAFASERDRFSVVKSWVVGGHSLGGTVAAMTAQSYCHSGTRPVVGLLLFASYPANDLSTSLKCPVLSISASNDGLATPAQIDSTKALLPAGSRFVQIAGAVHAYFGDYGTQSGDGQPTVDHGTARAEISKLAVQFLR